MGDVDVASSWDITAMTHGVPTCSGFKALGCGTNLYLGTFHVIEHDRRIGPVVCVAANGGLPEVLQSAILRSSSAEKGDWIMLF